MPATTSMPVDLAANSEREEAIGVMQEAVSAKVGRIRVAQARKLAIACCDVLAKLRVVRPEQFAARLRTVAVRCDHPSGAIGGWLMQMERFVEFLERMHQGDWCTKSEMDEWLALAGLIDMSTLRANIVQELKLRGAPIYARRKLAHR